MIISVKGPEGLYVGGRFVNVAFTSGKRVTFVDCILESCIVEQGVLTGCKIRAGDYKDCSLSGCLVYETPTFTGDLRMVDSIIERGPGA